MKIHSDTLTLTDMHDAARKAGVRFERLMDLGSRSRDHSFDFYISGSSYHRANSGIAGPRYDDNPMAATWDEWGIMLGELFRRDPNAHCGKNNYESREHYEWVTSGRFTPEFSPADQHRQHRWIYDGTVVTDAYHVSHCACGAHQRRMAGVHPFSELLEV